MRLRLRFLLMLLMAALRPRIGPLETSTLWLRVLPNDVDLLHVTNDRYLAYMDLGRNDLVVRMGLLSAVRRAGAYPVVRSLSIRYRRAARLFQRLELRTRILCWDDQGAWFEQEFFARGRSVALAYCKAELRTKAGPLKPGSLLTMAGHRAMESPALPPLVQQLEGLEGAFRASQLQHDA